MEYFGNSAAEADRLAWKEWGWFEAVERSIYFDMLIMKRGPKKGHPGWGGRPRGVEMPCGWGCGAKLTAAEMRKHFTECPKKPKK